MYSGDFASDLRAAIGAVARLPFEGDQVVDVLRGIEPTAANDPNDEDHTTFWLVVADQFAKRGISSERVREKAIEIIDQGTDIEMLARLGMAPILLEKRRTVLRELRGRIAAPASNTKKRVVLKKPQAFVMECGEAFIYPTSQGQCINSYFPSKLRIPNWRQDSWSAAIIVDAGRAFGFLAWYRPVTLLTASAEKPDFAQMRLIAPWVLRRPGTCSPVHFKRMELEKVGTLPVEIGKLKALFPEMKHGTYQAVNDISIVNELSVRPERGLSSYPIIAKLDSILS